MLIVIIGAERLMQQASGSGVFPKISIVCYTTPLGCQDPTRRRRDLIDGAAGTRLMQAASTARCLLFRTQGRKVTLAGQITHHLF